jgi:hypothetical protein
MMGVVTVVGVCAYENAHGTGTQGISSTGWILVNELSTQRLRTFLIPVLYNMVWVMGYCMTGVIAMFYDNWRTHILIANVPFVFVIAYFWLVHTSVLICAHTHAGSCRKVCTG